MQVLSSLAGLVATYIRPEPSDESLGYALFRPPGWVGALHGGGCRFSLLRSRYYSNGPMEFILRRVGNGEELPKSRQRLRAPVASKRTSWFAAARAEQTAPYHPTTGRDFCSLVHASCAPKAAAEPRRRTPRRFAHMGLRTDSAMAFLDCLIPKQCNFNFHPCRFLLQRLQVEQPNPIMMPATGERLLRFVGDKVLFQLRVPDAAAAPKYQARLRTNSGRAAARRREIIDAHAGGRGVCRRIVAGFAYAKNRRLAGRLNCHLPRSGSSKPRPICSTKKTGSTGPMARTCAFPCIRILRARRTPFIARSRGFFGATKNLASTADAKLEAQLKSLEAQGYATLPPSGTFRDLTRQLPFIVNKLGCRIIHLLPVHPTPTVYGRFGRFGSPYAALDMTAVDPALVGRFDKRNNGH